MRYLIYFLLLNTNTIFAQNPKFVIKDEVTNQPISFAAIYTPNGIGTYSGEDGSFNVRISKLDTIIISHLSYFSIKLSFTEITNMYNSTIYLKPKIIELSETIIKPNKTEKFILGYYNEKTFFKRVGPGGQSDFSVYVNHVKNLTHKEGFLNKLYFDLFVDIAEKSNSKVRIRVFSVGPDGLPKDDILTKEIIKRIDRFTPNLKIDVSKLNILFPPEGVFIGLEFFCNFERKSMKTTLNYKSITNCPHIPTAKVINNEITGNSFYWTILKGKLQWVCYSNGNVYKGTKGHVFKFGAEVSQ